MFGSRVRARRIELGWSQYELGSRVDVSAAQISRIETGERGVSMHVALELIRVLDLPASSLVVARGKR